MVNIEFLHPKTNEWIKAEDGHLEDNLKLGQDASFIYFLQQLTLLLIRVRTDNYIKE